MDAAAALRKKPPEDLRFERLERGCALGDLFEGVAHLLVCEAVGAGWIRKQVVEHDFGWLGRRPFSAIH
ncbi:MAG: hypothetical protein ACLQU2_32610 [Candidatus Binataceae bacterium]